MTINNVDYSSSLNDGVGTREALTRAGYLDTLDGARTPKTDNPKASELPENLPAEQAFDPETFKKDDMIVWQELISGGRQYVTYGGIWYVDFLAGNRAEAEAWRTARLNAGERDFYENEYPDGILQFKLNKKDSEQMLASRSLRLGELRTNFDNATEISPYFAEIPRYIPAEVSSYLTYHSIEELEKDQQLQKDLLRFDDQVYTNRPQRMLVNNYNPEDVSFYYDVAGNFRAAYDPHMLYLARPLLTDLVQYAQPEEYCLARYPSGTVHFVLMPELIKRLLEVHKSEIVLVKRYNNVNTNPGNPVEEFPEVFENAINLETKGFVSTRTLFGEPINTEKK